MHVLSTHLCLFFGRIRANVGGSDFAVSGAYANTLFRRPFNCFLITTLAAANVPLSMCPSNELNCIHVSLPETFLPL